METSVYKVRGSHRTERNIRNLLGRDPDIHSGFAGKGAFCIRVSEKERNVLSENGFKIAAKKSF